MNRMDDSISRQAAIDIVDQFSREEMYHYLESLELSVQATIVCHSAVEVVGEIKEQIEYLPPVNKKQITGKLETAENATSEGEESTMSQPKSKLYIPLNQHTVERINRLHKNDCGDYFDEELLYNELEQIAEIFQLSGETSTISGETSTNSEETSTNSNKNLKDNLSFPKSVKLINPCNSLLKPDSEACKEQKSKLESDLHGRSDYKFCPNCGAKMGGD